MQWRAISLAFYALETIRITVDDRWLVEVVSCRTVRVAEGSRPPAWGRLAVASVSTFVYTEHDKRLAVYFAPGGSPTAELVAQVSAAKRTVHMQSRHLNH